MSHHQPSARSNAHLRLTAVTVELGGKRILSDVDLTVTATDRIGIVGENGRGKTTLLHVLAGDLPPTSGTVARQGSIAVARQEMPIDGDRTVAHAVASSIATELAAVAAVDEAADALATDAPGAADAYQHALEHALALDAWDAERRVQIALNALGAPPEQSRMLRELSVGQRYRVRLACLLGSSVDFLLLDEPTNHLDAAGLTFLSQSIRERKGGVVVVSHDRALLADSIDTVVDLDPRLENSPGIHGGGYDAYMAARAAEVERWEQRHAREKVERARLEDALASAQARLVSGWRPPKGTGKHARATRASSHVTQAHRRSAQLDEYAVTAPEPPLRLRMPASLAKPGAHVATLEEVRVDGRLPGPVSLDLRTGERLLITGPNGAGKSTLLAVLAGQREPTAGAVRRSREAVVTLLSQESHLPPDRRAGELYRDLTAPLAQAPGLSALGLLRESEANKRVGELSMGQQRRLSLALALAQGPHALLLDEPTNHLSIALVNELTDALGATAAAVVVATHDRQMLRDLDHWPQLPLPTTG